MKLVLRGKLTSKWFRKFLSVSCVTNKPLGASRAHNQARPCPCGSMSTGYRAARVAMMPFWVERLSVGNPCTASHIFSKLHGWDDYCVLISTL